MSIGSEVLLFVVVNSESISSQLLCRVHFVSFDRYLWCKRRVLCRNVRCLKLLVVWLPLLTNH